MKRLVGGHRAKNSPLIDGFVCIAVATLLTACCTSLLGMIDLANIVMIFLLSTFLIAITLGGSAAILSSVLNVAFFDFFFVTPRFSFSVDDSQYLITFWVMLIVGLVTGQLGARLKEQLFDISVREKLAKALQALSKGLFNAKSEEQIVQTTKAVLEDVLGVALVIVIKDDSENIPTIPGLDMRLIKQAMQSGTRIIQEPETTRIPSRIYLPIRDKLNTLGLLVATDENQSLKLFGRDDLLQTAVHLLAMAITQTRLVKAEEDSKVQNATERLKSAILSSLSHDLRTPLTTMIGLAERLEEGCPDLAPENKEAIQIIRSEGIRLSGMIGNLLEMARIQTQGPKLKRDWQLIEEVIGTSIKQLQTFSPKTQIKTDIDVAVPPLYFDEILIERVLCNLLENAAKYSSLGSTIEVTANIAGKFAVISVIDSGQGFVQNPEQLFDMFSRGISDTHQSGMGLGLAICKEIVQAHGGSILAKNNEARQGATVSFTLPITENKSLPKP